MPIPIPVLKRQARALSRAEGIPLHAALDRIAQDHGHADWPRLTARAIPALAARIQPHLPRGSLGLIAARPGHGKTSVALSLAQRTAKAGRRAAVFSLDYGAAELRTRLDHFGSRASIETDTSDDICADYVIDRLGPDPTFAVIDYLQLLGQRRDQPPLADQVAALHAYVRKTGATLLLISQIDRRFDGSAGLPGQTDLRLPNPVDLSLIDRAVYLHDGTLRIDAA